MIWTLKKSLIRVYHYAGKGVTPLLLIPAPETLSGPGKVKELPGMVKSYGVTKVMVVTDKGIQTIGLAEGLFQALKAAHLDYIVFDDVQPNPTIPDIENGLKAYQSGGCNGIIAIGGGSPMDCAKVIGARATNPKRPVEKMRGLFKIWHQSAPLFAVPTTAGTGSETTIAAVVTDPETHEKFAVNSFKNVPLVAVLDPELMVGLPPHLTSATGMDALTHAVEAYIGLHNLKTSNENAEFAVKTIFSDLEAVYRDGSDVEKRANLAQASFRAGLAFTRVAVGYVHAIAHNLGGLYGIPHGLANAIVMPYVLEASRKNAEKKLAKLALASEIGEEGETAEVLANRFIEKIRTMNRNMDIPDKVKEIREKDIPLIAQRARKEAHPVYPVPKLMSQKELEALIRRLMP